ncbi:MAG TPA: hypothetical protein P5543_10060 [Planctomycetota bacterium]|nr:hypothetical protein [Planctomycetota bacterium]
MLWGGNVALGRECCSGEANFILLWGSNFALGKQFCSGELFCSGEGKLLWGGEVALGSYFALGIYSGGETR